MAFVHVKIRLEMAPEYLALSQSDGINVHTAKEILQLRVTVGSLT